MVRHANMSSGDSVLDLERDPSLSDVPGSGRSCPVRPDRHTHLNCMKETVPTHLDCMKEAVPTHLNCMKKTLPLSSDDMIL